MWGFTPYPSYNILEAVQKQYIVILSEAKNPYFALW